MAQTRSLLAALGGGLAMAMACPVLAAPPPLPPLPADGVDGAQGSEPVPQPASPPSFPSRGPAELAGNRVVINGQEQRAAWRWLGPAAGPPLQLWLPLEVLQGQLGVGSNQRGPRGELELDWYGRRWRVPPEGQRALGDEVAIDLAPLLASTGLTPRQAGPRLSLDLPPPPLLGVRASSAPPGQRRVVLDLGGPAVVRGGQAGVQVDLASRADQRAALAAFGLRGQQQGSSLVIRTPAGGAPRRIFTLGSPDRLVLDLDGEVAATGRPAETSAGFDPRLQGRLGRQIQWDREVRQVAGRPVRINTVRFDPSTSELELRPLARPDGMEGLSSLVGLARRRDALVAVNGGFFNRIRRLPLGALRERGRWLSGPILNRGALGWDPHAMPRFGRLRLEEALLDSLGNRWPLVALNSGWLQRGLSRYTPDWGPAYRSLSDGETAALVSQGVVRALLGPEALASGVPLNSDAMLVVARSGFALPWREGERLRLESRPSATLGQAAHVLGGGPLLLLDGRSVLNGAAEGFSAAFLAQGAPRTVVASDGRQLWLLTLEGVTDEGPTLAETAWLLQQLGLRDALNLDGGSSTGLVMGGVHTVKGRGVAGAVHNALGLVPTTGGPTAVGVGP